MKQALLMPLARRHSSLVDDAIAWLRWATLGCGKPESQSLRGSMLVAWIASRSSLRAGAATLIRVALRMDWSRYSRFRCVERKCPLSRTEKAKSPFKNRAAGVDKGG